MTPKTDKASAAVLAERIPRTWEPPAPLEGATLLEQGLLCVLTRRLSRTKAEATIKSLREAFLDWNELRVAQVQEIVPLVSARGKNGAGLLVARDVKEYLQEIFQKNHGFDLEFLREDPAAAGKFLAELPFLGAAASHYLLWIASGQEFPVSHDLVRVFDRLGLIGRTSSLKKARGWIEPLVPAGKSLDFAIAFATVVEGWCDKKKPICWECPLLSDCPHGKKVHRDWKAQQERLEAQRVREAARAAALEKKERARQKREDQRRKREAERLQKRLEREQAKREREQKRKRAAEEKKKKQEERAKQREQAAREAEKKKAAAAKGKAKKGGASRGKNGKKPTTKKKTRSPAPRKKTTKKPARKTTGKKKTLKTTRKPAAKKVTRKTTKKPSARKSSRKPARKTTRKGTRKKR